MVRRDFLVGAGLLAVARAAASSAPGLDWGAVRREFRLDPRVGTSILNTPEEIDATLNEIRAITR
ncbi:hypothetical protein [Lentzea sp. NPDC059081]|uniref:hypothetical protein n=1 Tax=Lentzea sp. NPDC059081 TaxID=3346719 RepID=UPI0036C622D3